MKRMQFLFSVALILAAPLAWSVEETASEGHDSVDYRLGYGTVGYSYERMLQDAEFAAMIEKAEADEESSEEAAVGHTSPDYLYGYGVIGYNPESFGYE